MVVTDHCHYTGKFRGAAHQNCNIQFRKSYAIPCFFHNLSGYDSHHIFMALKEIPKETFASETTVIAKTLERFTCMTVAGVTLKDSCQLWNCGLDKLVENLKDKGQREYKTLQKTFHTTYANFKKEWMVKGGIED